MNSNPSKFENQEVIVKYLEKIKEITDNVNKKLDELNKQIEAELPIKAENLSGEADRNIGAYQRYLWTLTQERRQLASLRGKRDVMDGELQDYYRFNWDKSTKLTETAISKYVGAHPCFSSLNNLVKDQEALVLFLDVTVANFRDRGFAIKNMIEMKKIELGL